MCLLKNTNFYLKRYSNLKTGIKGVVLLSSGFYYSFTLFDKYTDWKDLEVLEDQYSNLQIDELEKEILHKFEKTCIRKNEESETIFKLKSKLHSTDNNSEFLSSQHLQ